MSQKIDPRTKDLMLQLREQKHMTLAEIGKQFGVCRERVRQIIGNTGNHQGEWHSQAILEWSDKTNSQLSRELGLSESTITHYRGDTRHAVEPDSEAGKGAGAEEMVARILQERGIYAELQPFRGSYDIRLSNGTRIDVKAAYSLRVGKNIKPFYNFNARRKPQGRYTDFFILYIVPDRRLFVIPWDEAPINSSIRIQPDKSRWNQFEDRFELLTCDI
jgi:transcriptional regulator with XRE-family HTH domain